MDAMLTRILLGFLILMPAGMALPDRGPSTAEERSQALDVIHQFQADPLNPALAAKIQWVVKWTMEVPDIRLDLCTSFFNLPKADSKDGQKLFNAMVFAQTAFVLENPDKKDDGMAQVEAGVDGVLHTYEQLLKVNAKDKQPFLNKLIKRRNEGTLKKFVEEHASSSCNL
jgi:hypothetical protein